MPEETQSPPPSISPTLGKHSRNWKKILLIVLILGFSVSLIGVGIYVIGTGDFQIPSSQKQATSTAKPKEPAKPLKNKIIFTKSIVAENGSDTDIYAMNPDGTGEIKIFDFESSTGGRDISLSPKNTYLSWIRGDFIYYILPNKTTQKLAKKIGPFEVINGYSISPDETKIGILVETEKSGLKTLEMKILDFTSMKELNNLTIGSPNKGSFTHNNRSMVWVNNEKLIIFTQNKEGQNYVSKFSITNGKDSLEILITPSKDYMQTTIGINSSKTKIAYAIQKASEDYEASREEVWLADTDGKNKKIITQFSFGTVFHQFEFSPDGKWLSIPSNNAESTEFQLVNLVDGKVIKNTNPYFSVYWSLGSNKFVTASGVYRSQIAIVGLDGEIEKELTPISTQSNKVGSVLGYAVIGWIK